MKVYQYYASGRYAGEGDTHGGPLPNNSTCKPAPDRPWKCQWPRWTGTDWELVSDHRERSAALYPPELVQKATDYWLPAEGDDWQSQPRRMKDIGPLPEGAVTVRPEKPLAAVQDEKRREIDAGYEAALVAALTMPIADPTPMTVSVETSALLAVDPDAVDSIKAVLDVRRAELLAAVEAADTAAEAAAIVVIYPA